MEGLPRRAKAVIWQCQDRNIDQPAPAPVVLVVEINQGVPLLARIIVQIHPASPAIFLPAQIELSILTSSGQTIIQAMSRSIDNYLQLPFEGKPGESFQVKLVLGAYQIIENFQI